MDHNGTPTKAPYMEPVTAHTDLLPAQKVAEAHLLAECVSRAISVGLAEGFKQVLGSPEMGHLLERMTQGNAVTGILQGLAAKDGRNSLDARTMTQNGLEMAYSIKAALGKLKEMQSNQDTPQTEDLVDPEQQYLEWKKKQEEEAP